MIDFNRKPSPKSADEKAFDELNAKYAEKFGTPYVFSIGADGFTWAETLQDIRKRIETNDPQPKPDYDPDLEY